MNKKLAITQYNLLKEYADNTNMRLAAEEWDVEWKIIVAILMSAQTRDEVTIEVAEKLFKKYPTVAKLAGAKVEDVEKMISRVNYYRTKAKHIVASCEKMSQEELTYNLDYLTSLPGVGRKTANVFLAEVKKGELKGASIGVDTHVNRISNKLGWVKTDNPDKVEQELMKLFPQEYWNGLNSTLVRFGKGYGTSRAKEDELLEEIRFKTGVKQQRK